MIPCLNDVCACLRDCGTRIPNHFSGSCCGFCSLRFTRATSDFSLLALSFASFSVISFLGLFLRLTPVKLDNNEFQKKMTNANKIRFLTSHSLTLFLRSNILYRAHIFSQLFALCNSLCAELHFIAV